MHTVINANRLRAQMAVMRIFRTLGVLAGEPVHIGELARHWADLGIRSSDLGVALDDLVRKNLIFRPSDGPDHIAQTRAGEAWFDHQPAWVEYQLLAPRAARAAYLRQQAEGKPAAVRRRRREDLQARRGTA
jgi:hypothetical protein